VAPGGAGVRWRAALSLTHLEVRSLRCSDAAFAGTVCRHDPLHSICASRCTLGIFDFEGCTE
jgi:hypothetical protein